MAKDPAPHWWVGEPGVAACPQCGCPIQRSSTGTVADGMRAHYKAVHLGITPCA